MIRLFTLILTAAVAALPAFAQSAADAALDPEGARDSRSRHHPRYARRHQSRQLHAGEELHAAARDAGEPAEDGRRRSRCRVLHRLRGPGSVDARRLRRRLQAGGGEVRRGASPHEGNRARADRTGADRRRRAAHREVGQEGGVDRHRERVSARHRHQAGEGVLRSRRPLHFPRAQRPQPVRRFQHRRARRQVAAQRPQRARQAGDCRSEQVGADDRSLASLEGREHAGAGVVESAGDCLALGGARARRSFAQHGRRAAAGVEEERRRHSDGGVCELRQDQQAGFARAGGGDCRAAQGVRPARGRAGRRSRHRRRPGRRRDESPDAGAARAVHRADGGDRQEHAGRSARHRRRVRQSHRLPREEDRPRSRRHLVGLRRRRRRDGLERRRRNLQRDAGAGAARLHRGTDRQDLERQPAARDGRGRQGREADSGRQ